MTVGFDNTENVDGSGYSNFCGVGEEVRGCRPGYGELKSKWG